MKSTFQNNKNVEKQQKSKLWFTKLNRRKIHFSFHVTSSILFSHEFLCILFSAVNTAAKHSAHTASMIYLQYERWAFLSHTLRWTVLVLRCFWPWPMAVEPQPDLFQSGSGSSRCCLIWPVCYWAIPEGCTLLWSICIYIHTFSHAAIDSDAPTSSACSSLG